MGEPLCRRVLADTLPPFSPRLPLLPPQGIAGRPVLYRGVSDCLRQIARREGVAAFYAAALPSLAKVAPSIGIMYFMFELLVRE